MTRRATAFRSWTVLALAALAIPLVNSTVAAPLMMTNAIVPAVIVAQTKATGAAVQVATWKDHHHYAEEDVAWLAHAARRADHVVITQKDAVKLRDRWPTTVPEPLVAMLDLEWEDGGEAITAALDAVVTPVDGL